MARISTKNPDGSYSAVRSWVLVVVVGAVLAVVALVDRGGLAGGAVDPPGDGSSACRLVAPDGVNIRSAPSQDGDLLDTVPAGTVVEGTRDVTDGFRQLTDGRWASDGLLTPLPDTNCG